MDSSPLTPDQIAELKRTALAATGGTWSYVPGDSYCAYPSVHFGNHHFLIEDHSDELCKHPESTYPGRDADARYIAAANPAVILALIEEIASLERYSDDVDREGERLTKRVAELEKALREIERTAACEMNEKFSHYDTIYTLAHALGNCHDECPVKQEGLKKLSALSGANGNK